MPVHEGMGYSQYHTPKKQDLLESLIKKTCWALRGIHFKHPDKNTTFHWIDAYSGPGYNSAIECNGSPVIFQNVMNSTHWRYQGFCIDKESKNIEHLKFNLRRDRNFSLFVGDCADIIPTLFQDSIEGEPYGILYMDNNGAPNFSTAKYVSEIERLRHIDFVFHLPATSIKRKTGAGYSEEDLYSILQQINKSTWYIFPCHHIGSDPWQWVMILGTNYKGWKGLKNLGFYDITSTDGEAILNFVNHTKNTLPELMKGSQKPLSAFMGA